MPFTGTLGGTMGFGSSDYNMTMHLERINEPEEPPPDPTEPPPNAPLPILYIDNPIFGGGAARLQNALTYAETNETCVGIPPGIHTVNAATVTTTKVHRKVWGLVSPFGGEIISNTTNPVVRIIAAHETWHTTLHVHARGSGGGLRLETSGSGVLHGTKISGTVENVNGTGILLIGNIKNMEIRGRVRGCTGNGIKLSNDGTGTPEYVDFKSMFIAQNQLNGILLENTNPTGPNPPRNIRVYGGHILINFRAGIATRGGIRNLAISSASFESNCTSVAGPQLHMISGGGVHLYGGQFGSANTQGSKATTAIGGTLSDDFTTVMGVQVGGVNPTSLMSWNGTNNTHVALWACVGGLNRAGGPGFTAHHCRGTNLQTGVALNLAGISTG